MSNRDLVNATGLASWIVANGYRPHMTRKMVQRLVRTDPDAPEPVPSAGSETVYSLSQWRCYLDPTADPSQARQYLGTTAHPDVVDGEEMARRVISHGYASTMSQVMVLRLARGDADFPATLSAGDENQERLFSWTAALPYWQARAHRPSGWVRHLRVAERDPDWAGTAKGQAGPRSTLVVAVAQPQVIRPPHVGDQVHRAVAALHEAARWGAELLLFPEGYPGPLRVGEDYDPAVPLAEAAATTGCAVCWSRIEADRDGRFHLVVYMIGSDGRQLGRYLRAHPATGDVHQTLSGTAIAPGPALADLIEVAGVPVGLLVCSELWLPEAARVLAIRGAELLLAPAGGAFGPLARNWQAIARARAIENQCYLALTQGLFGEEPGLAMIAGPEDDVAALAGEGVLVAQLDLQRARWLRTTDDSMAEPKPFRSLPGLLRARRPGLYAELTDPADGLYDYQAAATRP
jgi:5-aminopentanamidase